MARRKEAEFKAELLLQGPVKMALQTKNRLEEKLNDQIKTIKEQTLELGGTQDHAADWHDNAAYDLLQQELAVGETSILRLKTALQDAEIIEPRKEIDNVQLGNGVVVRFAGKTESESFTILGPFDYLSNKSWISSATPLAQALIGQEVGAAVEVNTAIVELLEILPGDF